MSERIAAVSLAVHIAALSSLCLAGVVTERELLLRNALGVHRPDEIVAVPLNDLSVPVEVEKWIVDVEVRDASGKRLPCQYDPLGQLPGLRSEVALEIDLERHETRLLVIRFLDAKRDGIEDACTVELKERAVRVTTPIYSVGVATGTSLSAIQPKITPPQKTLDEELDELGEEAEELGPDLTPGQTPLGGGGGPSTSAPLSGDGLPFSIQGLYFNCRGTKRKAWGGPVRAVVALFHPGPWRVAKTTVPCTARQSFSFPRSGKRFFFDVEMSLEANVPKARVSYGGLRVDSANQPWNLIMGQKGKPPRVAPVKITLNNTKRVVLEPYQRATFNNAWAQAVAKDCWIGLFIDRLHSNLGIVTGWGTGRRTLPNTLGLYDDGLYSDSVRPGLRYRTMLAAPRRRLRATYHFGGKGDKRPDGDGLSDRFNAVPFVAHQTAKPNPPPDPDGLRGLVRQRNVVVVVPDLADPDRTELWHRLADGLGGTWRRSTGFLPYFGVVGGEPDPSLLIVLVGEPGTNFALDQFNRSFDVFSPYPAGTERSMVSLFEDAGQRSVLFVAGNSEKATSSAVDQLLQSVGELPARPAISASPRSWTSRMPQPWFGLRDHPGPFRALAYRNSRAEFLFLLRANRPVKDLKIEIPDDATCRYVSWQYRDLRFESPQVVPVHDAAFLGLPGELARDETAGVWISLQVPRDAAPGLAKRRARLIYEGGARVLPLEVEVLPLQLADQPGFGFSPIGASKEMLQFYYDWDDAEYYQRLPHFLRQRGDFGANAYSLNVAGLEAKVGPDGEIFIDPTEFARELEAVRAAGCIDALMTKAARPMWTRDFRSAMARKKLGDEYAIWEHVIPAYRKAIQELGLEEKLVFRYADEIPDYEGWLPKARIFKRCGFRLTVAVNGYGVFNKHLAVGTMSFWIPLYNFYLNRWGRPIPDDDFIHFSKKFRNERHAAGERIWPYVCGPGPYGHSGRPRSQCRFLILDAYMKGADGLTYYGGTVWSHGLAPAFRDKQKADLFNEDHTFFALFYPDYEHDGCVPSLRAGSFRLGHEDVNATDVVRVLAKEKRRTAEVEAAIHKSYATIDLNSSQEIFEAHRRALNKLYAELTR